LSYISFLVKCSFSKSAAGTAIEFFQASIKS